MKSISHFKLLVCRSLLAGLVLILSACGADTSAIPSEFLGTWGTSTASEQSSYLLEITEDQITQRWTGEDNRTIVKVKEVTSRPNGGIEILTETSDGASYRMSLFLTGTELEIADVESKGSDKLYRIP